MNVTSLPVSCLDELPQARFKSTPEDFRVDELLGFELDGEGEHLWVNICKTGQNTRDLVDLLAQKFAVKARDVGYSGLKDKHAVTTQWISLPLAAGSQYLSDDPADSVIKINELLAELPGVEVTTVTRSRKKLRTGAHRQNGFTIILRELKAPHDVVEQRLKQVSANGFPNYFGPQRFGRDGRNVASAQSMFASNRKVTRFKRGIYLSAARSYLFNLVLAHRVANKNWNLVLPGEACILDGTNSVFLNDNPEAEIESRCLAFDIHPSGPLHGRGDAVVTEVVADIEEACLKSEPALLEGLEKAGLKQERRALRAVAHELKWQWLDDNSLKIEVILQRGIYATSLLREIVIAEDVSTVFDHNQQAVSS